MSRHMAEKHSGEKYLLKMVTNSLGKQIGLNQTIFIKRNRPNTALTKKDNWKYLSQVNFTLNNCVILIDTPLKCDICDKQFSTKYGLSAHNNRNHRQLNRVLYWDIPLDEQYRCKIEQWVHKDNFLLKQENKFAILSL